MNQIIMLVEVKMLPIPDNIKVVQEFGGEAIMVGDKLVATGTSMLLSATTEALHEWLRPYEGFWTTQNPMVGKWEVMHVPSDHTHEVTFVESEALGS
jgi:N-dimethylarginine dimethylaminohydrolase